MYAAEGEGGDGGRLWWKVMRNVVVKAWSEARWASRGVSSDGGNRREERVL
jgi:hypothetical protein